MAQGPSHRIGQGSFLSGFATYSHMWRFIITVVFVFATICSLCVLLFRILKLNIRSPQVEISIDGESHSSSSIRRLTVENTGISFELDDGHKIASMLVPANQFWVDTKLDVAENSAVHISANGSALLSVSRSIDISKNPGKFDPGVYNNITKPNGQSLNRLEIIHRDADEIRSPLRILQKAPLGSLLAVIAQKGVDFNATPRPDGIEFIQDPDSSLDFRARSGGRLYLTINDLRGSDRDIDRQRWTLHLDKYGRPLNQQEVKSMYKRSYGQDADIAKISKSNLDRWNEMIEKKYWNMFIEDNIGYYVVSISIENSNVHNN